MEFLASNQTSLLSHSSLRDELNEKQQKVLADAELKIQNPLLRWDKIIKSVVTPSTPWAVHRDLYENNYKGYSIAPAWIPSADKVGSTNIGKLMTAHGLKTYDDLQKWSRSFPGQFWDACIKEVKIPFEVPYAQVFDSSDPEHGVKSVKYLSGARLNIAGACFARRAAEEPALIYASETDGSIRTTSFAALESMANRVANALTLPKADGGLLGLQVGDSVGICMAMSVEAVAAYLGIIKAGLAVVSIADSFSEREIETRMRIAGAKACFTQDVVYRREKVLPIYTRVADACQAVGASAIVLPGDGHAETMPLHESVLPIMRAGIDASWAEFLRGAPSSFEDVMCPADHTCNILFSSGTTGEPKAIPWSHATPIKCAIDGYLHQDITVGEVVAWPTNLGWMMGPWLVFQFLNGATIALFGGVTSTSSFCKFVEDAKVSMLGVVPSLVKAWQTSDATAGCDWSSVTKFSSSGEASDPVAMHWLMSRVPGYAPCIEYCGGTEIAGSYMSSTLVQPNVPSMFSSPVLGNNFIILNDALSTLEVAVEGTQGEVALIPPAMGLSTTLLNKDHHNTYYVDMPAGFNGEILRRHGDEVQTVSGKWQWDAAGEETFYTYYRALGRCDDTMNIGGIKVSSVEIERICNDLPDVIECAAIGVSPPAGGPSILVIFAITPDSASMAPGTSTPDLGLKTQMQKMIKEYLNPLFHVGAVMVRDKLPRTASNKVMRRVLRDEYAAQMSVAPTVVLPNSTPTATR